MSVQAVSQHLKVLERADLVLRGQVAQTRPARLAPGALPAAGSWVEGYREFWEASFEGLDEYVEDLERGEGEREIATWRSRWPRTGR